MWWPWFIWLASVSLHHSTSPSSLSLTHAAVKSVRPLRGIAVSGAGQGKQHPAEFAYLSAFQKVRAVWISCHRNIPRMYCSTDRDMVCLLRFLSINISCFLLRSPTTPFTHFFPLLSCLRVPENPPSWFHPSTALEPSGLKIDPINILSFDWF